MPRTTKLRGYAPVQQRGAGDTSDTSDSEAPDPRQVYKVVPDPRRTESQPELDVGAEADGGRGVDEPAAEELDLEVPGGRAAGARRTVTLPSYDPAGDAYASYQPGGGGGGSGEGEDEGSEDESREPSQSGAHAQMDFASRGQPPPTVGWVLGTIFGLSGCFILLLIIIGRVEFPGIFGRGAGPAGKPLVVLVSLDGFRAEYIHEACPRPPPLARSIPPPLHLPLRGCTCTRRASSHCTPSECTKLLPPPPQKQMHARPDRRCSG
jgi:hypothetical protein